LYSKDRTGSNRHQRNERVQNLDKVKYLAKIGLWGLLPKNILIFRSRSPFWENHEEKGPQEMPENFKVADFFEAVFRKREVNMKRNIYLFVAAAFFISFLGSLAWAEGCAIIVNSRSMSISIIEYTCPGYLFRNFSTKVYGPFLAGSLGTPGDQLLDAAGIPDSNYVLVSNFGQHKVYRIDISDPTNPTLAGSLDLGTFGPEDIAVSPNGQFAVISNGGMVNRIAFIDLSSFSSYGLYTLTSPNGYANAVAIGEDNSTIVLCDYSNSRIIYGRVNATLSGLVSESTLPTNNYPINVSISPDGATALVACTGSSVSVFQITAPGTLDFGIVRDVKGFHDIPQSIAFNYENGDYAYVVCNTPPSSLTTLSMLQVAGPGNVSMKKERAATLFGYGGGSYYGVDAVVAPCSSFLIASNPSSSLDSRNRVTSILVDPNVYPEPRFFPTSFDETLYDAKGIALFSWNIFAPLNAALVRLTNNYIFYKEYINSLTWQANPKNLNSISKYRVYRKAKGADDSTYLQLAEVDASVFQYRDRGLKKNANYTYEIRAVNKRGLEGAPVEVSNVVVMRRAI